VNIRPKILIVDDKNENLVSLEKLLKKFDVEFNELPRRRAAGYR